MIKLFKCRHSISVYALVFIMRIESLLAHTRFRGMTAREIAEQIGLDAYVWSKRIRIIGNIVLCVEAAHEIYDAIKDNKDPYATVADLIGQLVQVSGAYVVSGVAIAIFSEGILAIWALVAGDMLVDELIHICTNSWKLHEHWG